MNATTPHRICIALHTLQAGGGVQERRVKLANHWAKKGYEVTIVVPTRPKKQIKVIDPRIKIVYLGSWKDRTRNHFLNCIPGMVSLFRKERYDVIFVSTPQHTFTVVLSLIISQNKTKLISSIHGTLNPKAGIKEFVVRLTSRAFIKLSYKRVYKFFGVSMGVSREVAALLNEDYIETIHNPVVEVEEGVSRINKARLREEIFPNLVKVVVAVGRLNKQKGFDMLINAVQHCDSDFKLFIIGEGEERPRLEAQIRKLGLEHQVILLGYKRNVIDYIGAADCFVLSSRYEGFGNVLVEALVAQTPIVSFDCKHGPADIIGENEFGCLVKCFDIERLAKEIDNALRGSGVFFNNRWKDFSVSKVADKYLAICDLKL